VLNDQFVYNENLVIPAGTDFTHVINVVDMFGNPVNLSFISGGMTGAFKEYYGMSASYQINSQIESISNGSIRINIHSDTTKFLKFDAAVWDIVAMTTSGSLKRIASGKINFGQSLSLGSFVFPAPDGSLNSAGTAFAYGPDAPQNPNAGDRWFNSTSGVLLTYVVDEESSQWVQFVE